MDEPLPFGRLVRHARLAAGLTQEALAERAGLSPRAVGDIERGLSRAPQRETAALLAEALGLAGPARQAFEAAARRLAARPSAEAPAAQPIGDAVAHPDHSTAPLAPRLPVAATSFVGREQAVADLGRLLGPTRLLTLAGSGGVGKTRLALEVARRVQAAYRDGVWLVELATLADAAFVPQAVAQVLGVVEQPGRAPTEALAAWLADKQLLLVLDNCEHLLDACAHLAAALLAAGPHLHLLATSQAALGIGGELVWRVPSLALPDAHHLPSVERVGQVAAVRLFAERAAFARPGFALTAQNAAAVVQVCGQLDGIPLALELAAARLRALPVEEIAQRLGDRFRLLTGGSRAALPRQQTLRGTIDWSHDLLTEAERAVLRRLAVFAGGCTIAAAEAVCAGEGIEAVDVLDLLSNLVDKSLLLADEGVGGEARYRLLATVRQYGLERLVEAGEADAVRDRHRDYFLVLAERAEPAMYGPEQAAWFDRLATELDNLRAALAWCVERSEPAEPDSDGPAVEAGLRLASALWRFWWVRLHHGEGRTWLDRALAHGRERPTAARAKALCVAGILHKGLRRGALFDESVGLYQVLGDERGLAFTQSWLGHQLRVSGADYAGGTARLAEGLRLAREADDGRLMAEALWLEAMSADLSQAGERARALTAAEESLALFQAAGDPSGITLAQRALGWAACAQGDYERARAAFAAALTVMRSLADRGGIVQGLAGLAAVARAQGDLAGAAALYRESLAQRRVLHSSWNEGDSLIGLAALAVARGQPVRAARLLGAAESLREEIATRLPPLERTGHEATVRAARAALGDDAFAAAWAAGQAMTPDEAVVEALAEDGGDG